MTEYTPITINKDTVIRILDRHFAAYMRTTYENEPLSGANGEIVRIARLLCDIAEEVNALGEVKGTKSK